MSLRPNPTTCILLLGALLLGRPVAASEPGADPWEGMNRRIFAFNEFLDRNLLEPASRGYQAVTPEFVDTGVTNFFGNLGEVPSLVNHLLQGQGGDAVADGGRFAVNSTLGLLGLFDVASKMGIEAKDTDLGLTLGHWGVGPGPYFVMPVLGPSTVRDTFGRGGDTLLQPLYYMENETARWSLRALNAVDIRADLREVEQLITGDRYTFLRDLYLQRRKFQLGGDDEFSEDDFEDEFGEEEF